MRDYRLDFLRGLALLMIFCDHVPRNVFASYTVHAIGFSEAAEFFFFLSGLVAGRVYIKMLREKGWEIVLPRIVRRTVILYSTQILLVALVLAEISLAFAITGNGQILESARMPELHEAPVSLLPYVLTFIYHGRYMDILPLYVIFFLALPIMLALARRHLLFLLLPSLLLHGGVTLWGWNFTTYPDGEPWFFNPLAWQAIFVLGLVLGSVSRERFDAFMNARVVIGLAAGIAALFAVLDAGLSQGWFSIPELGRGSVYTDKSNLGYLRLANFFVLFVLAYKFLPSGENLLRNFITRGVIYVGQHSLVIFCFGICITVLSHIIWDLRGGDNAFFTVFVFLGLLLQLTLATALERRRLSQRARQAISAA